MNAIDLPATITPEHLARHMGWSVRRVKALARRIGACHIMGNRITLTQTDVAILLLATKPNVSVDDVRQWLGEDAAEQQREAEHQKFAEPTGVVYFIRRGREVKIGFTTDLSKRLTNLRTGTTEPMDVLLTVPAIPVLERYFHEKFAPQHIEREWFRLDEQLELFIARRNRGLRQ